MTDKDRERHQFGQLSAIVMETLSYLGMSQHTDRFMRLLQQAEITSVAKFEKLSEEDCQEMHLPMDLVVAAQKRVKVWKLEMTDVVETELEQGEVFYANGGREEPPEPQAKGGRRSSNTPPPVGRAPGEPRSPGPASRSMPKDVQSQNDANALNSMARQAVIPAKPSADTNSMNTRLQKIEYLLSSLSKKPEEQHALLKTMQTDMKVMQETSRTMQQDMQRLRDTQLTQIEQIGQHNQHAQQQQQMMQQQMQQQLQQQASQLTQHIAQQQQDLMGAIRDGNNATAGPSAQQRRIEDQLEKAVSKLEALENQARIPRLDNGSEALRALNTQKFDKIESMLVPLQNLSIGGGALDAAAQQRVEQQLASALNKLESIERQPTLSNGVQDSQALRNTLQGMSDQIQAVSQTQCHQQNHMDQCLQTLVQRFEKSMQHLQPQNSQCGVGAISPQKESVRQQYSGQNTCANKGDNYVGATGGSDLRQSNWSGGSDPRHSRYEHSLEAAGGTISRPFSAADAPPASPFWEASPSMGAPKRPPSAPAKTRPQNAMAGSYRPGEFSQFPPVYCGA